MSQYPQQDPNQPGSADKCIETEGASGSPSISLSTRRFGASKHGSNELDSCS